MKLIDKSALVAEIENLNSTYEKCQTRNSYEEGLKDGRLIGYKDALHKIESLEVKEVKKVNFEREMQAFAKMDLEPLEISDSNIGISITMAQLYKCARHFFRIGIEAQKGEEVCLNIF